MISLRDVTEVVTPSGRRLVFRRDGKGVRVDFYPLYVRSGQTMLKLGLDNELVEVYQLEHGFPPPEPVELVVIECETVEDAEVLVGWSVSHLEAGLLSLTMLADRLERTDCLPLHGGLYRCVIGDQELIGTAKRRGAKILFATDGVEHEVPPEVAQSMSPVVGGGVTFVETLDGRRHNATLE